MPVGNLVVAVAARQVDEDYVEWGWYAFGLGCLLWLALWPITFLLVRARHRLVKPLSLALGVVLSPFLPFRR